MKVFVVIPAYNENSIIRNVVTEVIALGYAAVVVDDGSDEPISKVLEHTNAYVLRHMVNLGQGAALQTGITFALQNDADFIVNFDADGQHNANDIIKLLDPLIKKKADIALGSRFLKDSYHNMNSSRKFVIKVARFINYLFTGILLSDAHNGLRAFTKEAARQINIKQNGMSHATEILSIIKKEKLVYMEVPVSIIYTDYSNKKGQSIWNSFRIFFDLLLNKIFR